MLFDEITVIFNRGSLVSFMSREILEKEMKGEEELKKAMKEVDIARKVRDVAIL